MQYRYGMRLRGFSIACQPMKGLVTVTDDPTGKYYNVLTYDRQLDEYEVEAYELDFVGKEG